MTTYTPEQVAEYLQTDVATVQAMARDGLLPKPCVDNGYITRWAVDSINRLVRLPSDSHSVMEHETALKDAERILQPCSGSKVKFIDFYDEYQDRCTMPDRPMGPKVLYWLLRQHYMIGRSTNNQNYIGNVKLSYSRVTPSSPLFLSDKGRLVTKPVFITIREKSCT